MPPDSPDQLPAWRLTDHVCRVCFGRVLERRDQGQRVVRCANCGTEVRDMPTAALCCCGLKTSTGKDAGLRCRRNDGRTPEQPAELAVGFGEAKAVTKPAQRHRTVAVAGPCLDLGFNHG